MPEGIQELSIDVVFKTPGVVDDALVVDPEFNRLDKELRGSIRKLIMERFVKYGELIKVRFNVCIEDGELAYVDPRVVRQ